MGEATNLFKQYGTNKDMEKAGIILDYGLNSKGKPIFIKIARAGGANQQFAKCLDRKTKPYRRQIQSETLDEEIGARIQREVYAESVILSWSGVEDADGNEIPFNRENCEKLLTDLPDLFTDIREAAGKIVLFRNELKEEEAKN